MSARGCAALESAPETPGGVILMKGARSTASLDWSQCPAVESIPGKVSGAWVFRGTRVPAAAIFENLKTSPIEEILENFHVTREQVQSVLDFAARSSQHSPEPLRGQ
jgi:uncharacterized protein (DUF433 family)